MLYPEYYSPHILEGTAAVVDPDPSFRKLSNRLIEVIFTTDIAIETGLKGFPVKQVKEAIRKEIQDIVALKTTGVDPKSEQAYRLRTLTKDILDALLSGTLLRAIHKSAYLEVLALSLELAKEPRLAEQLEISTGFGGSDQDDINLRVPAYILPGLRMLENLKAVFKKNNLSGASTFRIFFAPYAAIRVNGAEMKSDIILRNLQVTQMYLQQYIQRFHPDLLPNVIFEVELPWEQHDDLTTLTLNYFSHLLVTSTDPNVVETRRVLGERGRNRGGKDGERLSSLYAAAHPLLFKDGLHHPANMFPQLDSRLFRVSIGGSPERLFNIPRQILRANATMEGLSNFSDGNATKLKRWREEVAGARAQHQNTVADTAFHTADLPLISVPCITTIGSHPVYYNFPYDIGIHRLDGLPSAVMLRFRSDIEQTSSGKEKALELNRLKAVEHDITQLIVDAGGEQTLLEFVSSLLPSL